MIFNKICNACGTQFTGGNTAKYCPTCRAARIKQQDRERYQRKLAGTIRPIGSTDLCAICGKPYTVKGGAQKHCPKCAKAEAKRRDREKYLRDYADPAKRARMLARSRAWAIKNKDRMSAILRTSYQRRKEEVKDRRRKRLGVKLRPLGRPEICPKCGEEFKVEERNQKYCKACGGQTNDIFMRITAGVYQ